MCLWNSLKRLEKNHILPFGIKYNAWINGLPALPAALSILLSTLPATLLQSVYLSMLPTWLLPLAAFLLVSLSTYISFRRPCYEKDVTFLQQRLNEANVKLEQVGHNIHDLFRGILVTLLRKMGFNREDQARISIYVHRKKSKTEQGYFTCCGRYSSNPEFGVTGRTTYPDGQGCIWRGWETGWHYDDNFPQNKNDRKKYNEDEYNIPITVQEKFKMLSRFYAAKCLDDAEGKSQAVIVVEGMNKPPADRKRIIKKELEKLARDYAHMVKVLRDHIPVTEDAEEKKL